MEEENEKQSLFRLIVNSRTSVILYIVSMAIFFVGAIIGGFIVAQQYLTLSELIQIVENMINYNMEAFLGLLAIFVVSLGVIWPIAGLIVSFIPCLLITILMWIIYIFILWIKR